jgi:glutaredoxin
MDLKHVPGKDEGKIMLYALSTCVWCQKVKRFLDKLGVEYYYVNVDLLGSQDRDVTLEEVRLWNKACTFPTLVVNDEECIVGYKESEIKEALNIN